MGQSNLINIDTTALANGSTASAKKSLYVGSYGGTTPVVAIYGGEDSSVVGSPTANFDKLFFHTNFDYLRIKSAVTFNITLPERATRSSGGGKKGGSQLTSYNGYSDRYIHQHNYGSPPPAFSITLDNDPSNGSYAGMALAGSVPIQYLSNNSFRLAVAYSTDSYLVIRERYQVYQQTLPAITLKATAYFYNNPTNVQAINAMSVLHSPLTFNDVVPYNGSRNNVYTKSVTFTSQQGSTFNKVEILRFGGGQTGDPAKNPFQINSINGSSVTGFDTYFTWTTYTFGSQQTSFSMGVRIQDTAASVAIGKNKYVYYTPRWYVRFTNTVTGQTFTDSWGGVVSFYILP